MYLGDNPDTEFLSATINVKYVLKISGKKLYLRESTEKKINIVLYLPPKI